MKPSDPIEAIIAPIVEGQIRGFLKEHPSIVEAVDWYKPRDDKAKTFVNSLAKRIVRDLACPMTRARLAAALLEGVPGSPPPSVRGNTTAAEPAGVEALTAPAGVWL